MSLSEQAWYTPEMHEQLQVARKKISEIEALQAQVDALVEPYAVLAAASIASGETDAETAQELIRNTPDGFYRLEVRTAFNQLSQARQRFA